MSDLTKPVILVSSCLGFSACRYNNQCIQNKLIEDLKPYVDFINICPEVEIGLGTPREPIRLILENQSIKVFQPASGMDFTDRMNAFSSDFLSSLPEVDAFILKSRSPSCGIKDVKIYSGRINGSQIEKGIGLFAEAVIKKYPDKLVEDEGRLTNYRIREHFLIRLFTDFNFRKVKHSKDIKALIDFQSVNKYLLMAYSPKEQKILGKIVANHENRAFDELIIDYEKHLAKALSKPSKYTCNINVLHHIFGYYSKYLSKEERKYVLDTIEEHRQGKVPLSVPLHLLKSYSIKYKERYLLSQTIWQAYPEELIDISSSGKIEER